MKKTTLINKLGIQRSHMSFILPIGYNERKKNDLAQTLKQNGYRYFQLNDQSSDVDIYGEGIEVSGKELEQYFLPYVENKIFPESRKENGFHRYFKTCQDQFIFKIRNTELPFMIRSTDVILGPFGIAFLTVRIELSAKETELSDVLDFMHHFRAVESKLEEEQGAKIISSKNDSHLSVQELLFEHLCPFWEKFIAHDEKLSGYYGSFPFFQDERMYVTAFMFSEKGSEITNDQLYRMGALDGRMPDGEPFISTSNPKYIDSYLSQNLHDRWAPNSYTTVTEHAYMTVTNLLPEEVSRKISQYMGTHYYNFILHYFYKIMLLRISYEYSEINWEKDDEYVKSLIKFITLFSSWYFFKEISTRSEGNEMAKMFSQSFNIDPLFKEVNNTLQELYKSQENDATNRMNMLLFFLTVFTVVSGIYGMNLVIEDWGDPMSWSDISSYTFFEWLSLITAVIGIGLSIYLTITTFGKIILSKLRKRKSKTWML